MSWPKKKPGLLDKFRDEGEIVLTCGLGGCEESYSGPFQEVREQLADHRSKEHPEYVPSDPRKKKPTRKRAPKTA